MNPEYILLEAYNAHVLSSTVTEYLNNGWQLYGSPFSIHVPGWSEYDHGTMMYYQAVIKSEPQT